MSLQILSVQLVKLIFKHLDDKKATTTENLQVF